MKGLARVTLHSWHKQNVNCALPSPFHPPTPQGATQEDGQGGDASTPARASHELQAQANLTPPQRGWVLCFGFSKCSTFALRCKTEGSLSV